MTVLGSSDRAPDVYFPMEIIAREYAGHLLLAARLAGEGINVIIGHKVPVKSLIRSASEPGVIFYKSSPRDDSSSRPFRRSDGFAWVGQDPETGLPYRYYGDFVARRGGLRRLDQADAYFCFGPDDYDYLTSLHPEAAGRIHPTGSPRTMLWGTAGETFYAVRIAEIRERYGRFVLMASSGGRGNPIAAKRARASRDPDIARASRAREDDSARRAASLLQRARDTHSRTGLNVVIRPHPAESWVEWKRAVEGVAGVFIDSAYALGAWIRAAEFVVQTTRSTTAFEAWLADTPTIAADPPEPSLGRDGSRADLLTHELCLPYPEHGDIDISVPDIERRWAELRATHSPRILIERRLYSPPSDATAAISSIIGRLVDPGRPSGVRRTLSDRLIHGLTKRPNARRRERDALGASQPPAFKKPTLDPADVERDLAACVEILQIDCDIRAREILPNAFLVARA